MEVTVHNSKQTKDLASKLAKKLKPNDVIALIGDLGSGKTTFTRYLVQELNSRARVQSPTFIIHKKYECENDQNIKIVNHFDLYRFKTTQEVLELDLDETVKEPNSISIIEWPEHALSQINNRLIKIRFQTDNKKEETRIINITGIDLWKITTFI